MKKTFTKFFATLALLLITSTMWAQNITFMVDMSNYLAAGGAISANGVHMTGNFTVPNWDPTAAIYAFTQVGTSNVYSFTLNTVDAAQFVTPTDPDYRFKFINSQQANFSWGACHVDQECLPSGGSCTNGGDDNRSLGPIGSLPTSDSYYSATWDSCTGTIFTLTGINEIPGAIASIFAFPNPAKDNTVINFVLAQSAKNVTLSVYNSIGQIVDRVELSNQGAGLHNYVINTSDLTNGAYLYSLNADGTFATGRLVVAK